MDWNSFVETTQNNNKPEPLDRCKCKCGWNGLPSECSIGIEQESWEMPEYVIYLCPECDDEEGVEFYPSKEWMDRNYPEGDEE